VPAGRSLARWIPFGVALLVAISGPRLTWSFALERFPLREANHLGLALEGIEALVAGALCATWLDAAIVLVAMVLSRQAFGVVIAEVLLLLPAGRALRWRFAPGRCTARSRAT
jgi:hypothetical protein